MGASPVQLFGQVAAMQSFATVVTNTTVEELEDSLERSAVELEGRMREGITSQHFGLAPNTKLTETLKHGNVPLVDSHQLVQNITTSDLITKRSGGEEDIYRAYFVGVKRNAPAHRPTGHELGSPRSVSLYKIAKLHVKPGGYTVTLPRTGIKKHVPQRDFVTPAHKEHKKRHQELMKSGIASALSTGYQRVGMPRV